MKTVSGKYLLRIALAHGWVLDRTKGSHHSLVHPDKTNTVVIPVHANQDLKTGIQRRLMKDLGITDDDL